MKRCFPRLSIILLAILSTYCSFSVASTVAVGNLPIPRQVGWVNDYAGMLTPAEREDLSMMLEQYQQETHHQIAVLTMTSIGSEAIEFFSLRTANAWGLGYRGLDNGILVTLAVKERKARIELGRGMETYVSDADAADILATALLPEVAKGNYYAGLKAGLMRLMDKARAFVVSAHALPHQ